MSEVEDRARGVVAADARNEGEPGVGPGSPHSQSVTPSGIEIRYFEKPKRYYEIRAFAPPAAKEPHEATGWEEVPSVSTVTKIIDDPGPLIWWGMETGVEGVLTLALNGYLTPARLPNGQTVMSTIQSLPDGSEGLVAVGVRDVVDLLTEFKLTTNHVRDSAGDRGQNVHDALELWAKTGEMPDPDLFPPEEKGYVEGLVLFLADLEKGEPEVIASERMVASIEHGFAGRYDLEIRTHKPCEVVTRWFPKRPPRYATLQPGLYVPDLKTSGGVYPSHCVQLEGYEIGRVECGYVPSDARAVIRVGPGDLDNPKKPDGPHYELVKSWAQPADFLVVLDVYRSQQRMKERK